MGENRYSAIWVLLAIIKLVVWVSGFVIICNYLWHILQFKAYISEFSDSLSQEASANLKAIAKVAAVSAWNSQGIAILFAAVWTLFLPVLFYADISRLKRFGIDPRLTDLGRWKEAFLSPPPVTPVILAVILAVLTASKMQAILFIPIAFAFYTTIAFIVVVFGKKPDIKLPSR